MLDRYITVAETARIIGRPIDFVHRAIRNRLVTPALTRGEKQFLSRDVVKLAVMARLQDAVGVNTAVPALALKHADAAVDDLVANPDVGTVIALHFDDLDLCVSLPPLAGLLKERRHKR